MKQAEMTHTSGARRQPIVAVLIALVIGLAAPVSHGRQPAACPDPLHEVMRTSEVYSFDGTQ
jgi:hypothetical protein